METPSKLMEIYNQQVKDAEEKARKWIASHPSRNERRIRFYPSYWRVYVETKSLYTGEWMVSTSFEVGK